MKRSIAALSVATLSFAFLLPALAQSPDGQAPGQREADHMVRARATLLHKLDAHDTAPGYQFRAKLADNVHLNDGVELHRGDTLLGNVVTDDMNTTGRSRLAIRFSQAMLKNGQTIPIKATIVAAYAPGDLVNDEDFDQYQQVPNSWNDGTLRIDQINALHNVDLHSRIASHDSGVFVSTKDSDVKIPAGSEMALAIAGRNNAASMNRGS